MTKSFLPLIIVWLSACGCAFPGPAVSKSSMGNVAVNVFGEEGMDIRRAEVYIDDRYVGNASLNLPVLELKRGERIVRVEMPGCKTLERTLYVLGDPNHQVLNFFMERE